MKVVFMLKKEENMTMKKEAAVFGATERDIIVTSFAEKEETGDLVNTRERCVHPGSSERLNNTKILTRWRRESLYQDTRWYLT
ncbi:hypothetical protein UPYG_G00057820 [Umbra pygmaea]|uniref:Uncharacterized protein n=1 Tax=Umbra pygmaea TaxID=75934 RepID=A0ABD0X8M5_UMBPY